MVIIYHLLAAIDTIIYGLASSILGIIYEIATTDFFKPEQINAVANRIYIVVGVVMLFKLVISAVQYLVNPEAFDDKEKGLVGVIRKSAISIVLIAVAPMIFNFLIAIQKPIISTIPSIVFGTRATEKTDTNSIGFDISFQVLQAFVKARDGHDASVGINDATHSYEIHDLWSFNEHVTDGCPKISLFGLFSTDSCDYDYMIIISTLCGGFLCYVLLSMLLDVSIRTIKFGIIQILAPIPISSYVFSKDKLTKFVKTAGTVYADLFIRMAIIYFIIFAIKAVIIENNLINFLAINGGGVANTGDWFKNVIVNIAIIFGLLMFAKNAPKFISELLGLPDVGSGEMADMFKPAWQRAGGAAGALVNPARNAVSNWRKAMDNNVDWGDRKHRRRLNALRHAIGGFGKGALDAAEGVMAGDDWAKMRDRHNKSVAQSAKHGAAAYMRRTSKAAVDAENATAMSKMEQFKNFFREKKVDLHERLENKRQLAESAFETALNNNESRIKTLRNELMEKSLTSEERTSKINELTALEKEYAEMKSHAGKQKWISKKERELVAADLATEGKQYVSDKIAELNHRIDDANAEYQMASDSEKVRISKEILALQKQKSDLESLDISKIDDEMLEYVTTGELKTKEPEISRTSIFRGKVDQFFGGEGFTGQGYIDTAELLKNNRSSLYTGESMTKMRQNANVLVDENGNEATFVVKFTNGKLGSDGKPIRYSYSYVADLKRRADAGDPTLDLKKEGFENSAMLQSAFEDMEKQAAEAYVTANVAANDPSVKSEWKLRKGYNPNLTIVEGISRLKAQLAAANIPKDEKDRLLKELSENPGKFFKGASDEQEVLRTIGSRISAYNSGKKDSGS